MLQIEKIPVTRNGKVDKRALPAIEVKTEKEYIAPRNEIEEILCNLFSEILGVKKVGINDSFFELGGHSLRATRLANRIEAKTGSRIALKDIFVNTTPRMLAELITGKEEEEYIPIPKAEEKEYYPMSSTQKRIYLINQMDVNSTAYNMPQKLKLIGEVSPDAIRKALQEMINRHEILRTDFIMVNGEPVQKIKEAAEADFAYEEDTKTPESELMKIFVKPFDLGSSPLVRMKLVKRQDHSLLMIDMHHIVGDGMSMGTFIREFTALYNGEKPERLAHQYKDYSEWMQKRDLSSQREYWINEFREDIPVLDMPIDFPRPQQQSFKGAAAACITERELGDKIKTLARKSGATEYMIFLSAAMMMLGKYSRQEDIIIGSPISGRTHKDTESMLGMFVNTLAMRGRPEGRKNYNEFLKEVKESCLKAYENQEYPFEELVEAVQITRDMSRNPLFDVMLVLQNNEEEQFKLKGTKAEYAGTESTIAKFDLTFNITEAEGSFEITLEYCTDLFKEESAKGMLEHYVRVLEQIAEAPNVMLSEIEVITEEEKSFILNEFNDTYAEYPREKTAAELFEEQAEKTPDNTAVVYEDEEVTYAELNKRANVLAHKLRALGVKPDDFIVIMAERSIEMIAGIYGIIKAGGAYVPIDPTYPKDRIEYMLNDCKPKAVLTYKAEIETEVPVIDLTDSRVWEGTSENPAKVNGPSDLLYVIYTSGTTGKPKGVMVENKGVVSLKSYLTKLYEVNERDSILQFANYVFDASVWEMTMALLSGAVLQLVPNTIISDINGFDNFVNEKEITITLLPPQYYIQTEPDGLKILTTGGSASNPETVRKSKGKYRYINAYGPTENTVIAAHWEYNGENDIPNNIPIGKPISNTQIYILQGSRLCGIGVPGELCIAGDGLARGYLNRPELTAEKFIDNPFGKGKLYRSGDLARWLTDGNIEYLGRIDEQVKIRGYRIELGEIESVLRKIEYVTDAAVIAREDKNGEKAIYA
jgi:amino acid adenylation domain-containing protein